MASARRQHIPVCPGAPGGGVKKDLDLKDRLGSRAPALAIEVTLARKTPLRHPIVGDVAPYCMLTLVSSIRPVKTRIATAQLVVLQ